MTARHAGRTTPRDEPSEIVESCGALNDARTVRVPAGGCADVLRRAQSHYRNLALLCVCEFDRVHRALLELRPRRLRSRTALRCTTTSTTSGMQPSAKASARASSHLPMASVSRSARGGRSRSIATRSPAVRRRSTEYSSACSPRRRGRSSTARMRFAAARPTRIYVLGSTKPTTHSAPTSAKRPFSRSRRRISTTPSNRCRSSADGA